MHHERCLREPTTIQQRRRNCTDGQCPHLCAVVRVRFSGLSRDAFQTRRRLRLLAAHHVGNLYASPLAGQEQRSCIKSPPQSQARISQFWGPRIWGPRSSCAGEWAIFEPRKYRKPAFAGRRNQRERDLRTPRWHAIHLPCADILNGRTAAETRETPLP